MSAPPTNNRMSLAQARDELERHGFQCFERDRSVIGRRSNLAPAYAFMTRFDTFVVAHQVDNLSLERVTADIAKRAAIEKEYDFGRFPQFRSSRGRSFIVVYYADSIDPEALARITQEPKIEWCCSSFLAAQDGDGRSFFLEDTTPYRGWAKKFNLPRAPLLGRHVDGTDSWRTSASAQQVYLGRELVHARIDDLASHLWTFFSETGRLGYFCRLRCHWVDCVVKSFAAKYWCSWRGR